MKIRVLSPFLAFGALILIIGLACGPISTPTAQPPIYYEPTNSPLPPPPPTVVQPTATESTPAFFTEEFDALIPNWSWFLTSGDENKKSITSGDGYLKFDLQGENIWAYLMYDPFTYTDVRIDARADNRGLNNNNVTFICRYSVKEGWYEFNIANNGLYWILYGKWDSSGKTASYDTIVDGGSTAIRMGKDVNDYTIICSGEKLGLYINGVEVKVYTEKSYRLREGQVGLGVSSFDVWPIDVDWDYVTISQP